MTWFDAKRLIAILLLFFGLVSLMNVFVPYVVVPNTLILGVLLLMFGRQMYQEAELDKMTEKHPELDLPEAGVDK